MTYNLLPDFSASRETVRPPQHYPLEKKNITALMDGKDLPRQSQKAYKYYVLSDSTERVYTRMRTTETLYHQARGAILDVYA